jgi:hypothetical protein
MGNTHAVYLWVEVCPMVNFRHIDSGYLCKYNQSNRRYCPRGLSPLGSGFRAELLWSIQSLLVGLINTPAG